MEQLDYYRYSDGVYPRLLSSSNSTNATSSSALTNDGKTLRNTFLVYGSILLIAFLLFCWARLAYPHAFNLRSWIEEMQTSLALDQYGFLSWTWKVFLIADDEMLDECGMDALCLVRLLQMGYKICLMGAFCAIWLMPLYRTAEVKSDTTGITDPIVQVTIANVPAQSPRLVAAALASYFVFGYTMYLILLEFEWYTDKRHRFLRKAKPRNYTIFVRNVPIEFRSNIALADYFRQCFSSDAVLEANIRIKTPYLSKLLTRREEVVAKLEHAIAIHDTKGVRPTHKHALMGFIGESVDSISAYAEELKLLNKEIKLIVEKMGEAQANREFMADLQSYQHRPDDPLSKQEEGAIYKNGSEHITNEEDITTDEKQTHSISIQEAILKNSVDALRSSASGGIKALTSTAAKTANMAAAILKTSDDGEPFMAGFVTFSKLSTTSAALQMVHDATPFQMEVMEAPEPDDILWFNVGRSHKDLQLGQLFSTTATVVTCLFWTIPMAFFASLSSVQGLREQVPFVNTLLNKFPKLAPVFELLAPFLVVLLNATLPSILQVFCYLEGPISGAVSEASLFVKLSAFMIIQTFFISALSGGILSSLDSIVNSPLSTVDLLAESLPTQSTYFIQIVFVGTVMLGAFEILRVTPLAMALARRYIGPNLTKKEQSKTFLGIRPLADPAEFEHADALSNIVLYFMVIFVYIPIAPLVAFVLGFCFLYLGSIYRHQFIYIYATHPDSGGKLWVGFMQIIMKCMLVAEITILGLLALKKATLGLPLMIPLTVITFLFSAYVHQMHFKVAQYLPSRDCLKQDLRNGRTFDLSFLENAYLQPELQDKELFPEISDDREVELRLREDEQYMTPTHSEIGDENISERGMYNDGNGQLSRAMTESLLAEASFAPGSY